MNVLVIGASGNMGRRYCSILQYLRQTPIKVDIGDNCFGCQEYTHAIIATPTDTHFEICKKLAELDKTYLCEKPLSKNPDEIKELIAIEGRTKSKGYMVNNWSFATGFVGAFFGINKDMVYYNNWNTGKDGVLWDCIQLIYLAKDFNIQICTGSPVFRAFCGDNNVSLTDIDKSYISMIDNFLSSKKYLWGLQDALAATEKVIAYEKEIAPKL